MGWGTSLLCCPCGTGSADASESEDYSHLPVRTRPGDEKVFPDQHIQVAAWDAHEDIGLSRESVWTPNVFCNLCRTILESSALLKGPFAQRKSSERLSYGSTEDISQRASKGCHLCNLFLASGGSFNLQRYYTSDSPISQGGFNDSDDSDGNSVLLSVDQELWKSKVRIYSGYGSLVASFRPPDLSKERFFFKEPSLSPKQRTNILGMLPRDSWTGSAESLTLARHWLESCRRDHKPCGQSLSQDKHSVPSRLIECKRSSSINGQDVVEARIVDGSQFTSPPEYLILSHCWGGKPVLKLEHKTLASFQESIPWSLLPLTFREALQLTVALGYQYIWIDSLCILQDDSQDWAREAARMSTYYDNSACSIAAFGAQNATQGLFAPRNPLLFLPFQYTRAADGRQLWLYPDYKSIDHEVSRFAHYSAPRQKSGDVAFETRGWIMQERLLAPRTLFFGKTGLYWECRKGYMSERRPVLETEGNDDSFQLYPPSNLKKSVYIAVRPGASSDSGLDSDSDRLRDTWEWIMEQYSRCAFTFERDRLVALTGLVRLFETRTGQRNVAGLWEQRIAAELLWRAEKPLPRFSGSVLDYLNGERRQFNLPTWSWASLKGPVRLGHQNSLVCRIETEVVLAGERDMFPDYSGPPVLRVHGFQVPSKLELRVNSSENSYTTVVERGRADLLFSPSLDLEFGAECNGMDVWGLKVLEWSGDWGAQTWAGLLIVPVDAEKTAWARLGTWELEFDNYYGPSNPDTMKPDVDLEGMKELLLL